MTDATPSNALIRVPSIAGLPIPSPFLPVTPYEGAMDSHTLYTVPTLSIEGVALGDMLIGAGGREMIPALLPFVKLFRIGVELVARGRVLPSIQTSANTFEAHWVAVLSTGDADRVRNVARLFPASAFAFAGKSGTVGDSTRALLDEFVDLLVRRACQASGMLALSRPGSFDYMLRAPKRMSRVLPLDQEEQQLQKIFAEWAEDIVPAHGPIRVIFRLHEPAPVGLIDADVPAPEGTSPQPTGPWQVEILLASRADPSVVTSAATMWENPSVFAQLVPGADPETTLLTDLVRAGRLYPPINEALDSAHPNGFDCSLDDAHRFLRDGAPVLVDAGFGVVVPDWWGKRRRQIGLKLKAAGPRRTSFGPGVGADALTEYSWQVAIGDAAVSADEIAVLAATKAPLIFVRGAWVELRPSQMVAVLSAASQTGKPMTMDVTKTIRTIMGLEASPGSLPVMGIDGDDPLNAFLDSNSTESVAGSLPTPEQFHGVLRPYQEKGLGWLSFYDRIGLGACLADDMGLGKTLQLLALVLHAKHTGDGPSGPTLIVGTMSILGNWEREAATFAPDLRVHIHHGVERDANAATLMHTAAESDIVLTTYAVADRDRETLAKVSWARVVLDEAQAIKNSDTRARAALASIPTQSRIAMTGTPVENRLTELWSIMDFLNPGLLGTEVKFREQFSIPIERDADPAAEALLRKLTAPFILRRLKTDKTIAPELPDKTEIVVPCTLTKEQASLYQATVDAMLRIIEEAASAAERSGVVLKTITTLKQICNHPAQMLGDGSALAGRSGKLAALEQILSEVIAEGDSALIFTQYTQWAEQLRPYLRDFLGREVLYFHGGLGRGARDQMVERFQARKAPILLLSLKAGGVGLNLTAASHVIHYDRWWNPAVEDQATDRAYRIGQTQAVQVRKLSCTGTVEEKIAIMSESKRDLSSRVVVSEEGLFGSLSTTHIRELLSLSAGLRTEEAA
jgi:non-specific serine/threonine protein kinase